MRRRKLQIPVTGTSSLRWRDNLLKYNTFFSSRRLMHNHPSGDPTPSTADIQMTKSIIGIANPLGISVHDHIIVGKNGHASLKGLRLM